ncbi:hypothetical protein QTP70_013054 [Hemibagrus guttatus]|uniref:NADP-dependent oxidoreductase domain-containing protein n=1 Tax=Hemibagrus guttatus TaxID=175788 RepID=A0AAE0VA72_9TELE|nr:hypothetical protein QTP70_013054 [Hemibagrus guttatus]
MDRPQKPRIPSDSQATQSLTDSLGAVLQVFQLHPLIPPRSKNGKPDTLSQQFAPDEDDPAPGLILLSSVTIHALRLWIKRKVQQATSGVPVPDNCPEKRLFIPNQLRSQSYQWLKEKIMSDDGRKQQAKLKELAHIAEKLGCTLPQLAVAWCLRNEGVSSVLLGTSNPEQLTENLGAIQVLPKMTSHIVTEIDHILGNRPYTKKDYRS